MIPSLSLGAAVKKTTQQEDWTILYSMVIGCYWFLFCSTNDL